MTDDNGTPSEQIHPKGLTDDEDRILNQLVGKLHEKTRRNQLRASFYDGKRAAKQVGTLIPPSYQMLGIVLGWSAKAVDILARRCNLNGYDWSDGSLDELGLPELEETNRLGAEIKAGLVSSLIHGVSFLVTTEGGEGEPDALVHAKDALNATGTWNNRLRGLDSLLSVTSRKNNLITGFVLYLDGLTITGDKDGGVWTVDKQDHPWGVPAEALVYKPHTGRPFGTSRISRPIMSIHEQALRTVMRMEGHADVYSWPEMVLLGADEKIFRNEDGSVRPVWQTMLGRIKGIPDDDDAENPRADVKHFPAQSPEPHLKQLEAQAQMFSGEASIPLDSLGMSNRANPTSAESYIASREDLIAEAEGATDDWTIPIRRAVARGLAIQNNLDEIPAEWRSIGLRWRDPRYLSRASQADAGAKQLGAVPWLAETEVGLELLGLNDKQIKRALAERRRAEGRKAIQALAGLNLTGQQPTTGEPAEDPASGDEG